MRYWFDTEFIDDGLAVDSISVGVVREDGETFDAVSTEARLDCASDWVRAHVLPKPPPYGNAAWMSRRDSRSLSGASSWIRADRHTGKHGTNQRAATRCSTLRKLGTASVLKRDVKDRHIGIVDTQPFLSGFARGERPADR